MTRLQNSDCTVFSIVSCSSLQFSHLMKNSGVLDGAPVGKECVVKSNDGAAKDQTKHGAG